MIRIAAVLWSGTVGGAETFTVELCRTMRDLGGADAGIVFVTHPEPLVSRIHAAKMRYTSLGLGRGREVIFHPRALARAAQAVGPDGVLLASGGYLAAALRIGGYRGRVLTVMHDATFKLGRARLFRRFIRRFDRATGFWASDADVAVSDFVLSHIRRDARRGRIVRIYNGVDLQVYSTSRRSPGRKRVTVAFAGRLIEGKGVDVLLRAFAMGPAREGVRLRIGGDGPARPMLEDLAADLGLRDAVEFTGWTFDMPTFWRECDIATMPSDGLVESFGMAAVEAMACGIPVVATRNGALPELVANGVTGAIVPPGDAGALSDALVSLSRDAERRRAAGSAARARCEDRFDLRKCAASYLSLFDDLGGAGR